MIQRMVRIRDHRVNRREALSALKMARKAVKANQPIEAAAQAALCILAVSNLLGPEQITTETLLDDEFLQEREKKRERMADALTFMPPSLLRRAIQLIDERGGPEF